MAARPRPEELGACDVTAIPLGRLLRAASSNQPGRQRKDTPGVLPRHAAPIRSCSRWGLPCRARCRPRGALLPHLFTLTLGQSKGRYLFCGTFPEVAPAGHYPAPFLHGARTFLPSCDARPSDRLAFVLVTRLRNDFTQIQLPKLAMTIFAFAQ